MPTQPHSDLVDLIHDAAFDPALWGNVIARLCDVMGAGSAVMTDLDIISGDGVLMPVRQDASVVDDYLAHWATANPLHRMEDPLAYIRGWQPLILRDSDWMARSDLCRTAYFNDFLHPIDAEQSIFIRLGLENTVLTSISIARSERRGPFEDSEIKAGARYHRDMVRSMRASRQLRLAQHALDDLDLLLATTDQMLIFVDRHARVRRFSAAAEERLLSRGVLTLVDDRLVAPDPVDDEALRKLIGETIEGRATQAAITLRGKRDTARYRLTASPMGPRGLAMLSDERFVLLSAVEATGPAPAATREIDLRQRFGLTAAEARVTFAIAEGLDPRQAAERLGVSIHTVRAQLGTIFGKTATRRQADLIRLVLNGE